MCYKQSVRFQEEDHEALKEFIDIAASYYPDFDTRAYPKGHFDETCMDAVPLSFHIITLSSSFEDAIRLAISLGGDADTMACMAGGITIATKGMEMPEDLAYYIYNHVLDDYLRHVLYEFNQLSPL